MDHITICRGQVLYEIPGSTQQRKFIHRLNLATMITSDFDAEPPPPNLMQAMSRLTLYRMQERARDDLTGGNVRDATRRLQNLATHLLAQGQRDLARSVLGEVAHIQQNQAFSEEGDKRIKYRTRALLLPPGTKEKTL
jgi:Ca-activated chloride channel family protein